MTAKYYLLELAEMWEGIQCKKELHQEYLNMATSISVPTNEIKVKASHSHNGRFEKYGILAADIAKEIEQDEKDYYEHQYLIMNQIQALRDVDYIQILFKIYVQFKSIRQAAKEIKKNYQYIIKKHKNALEEFEKVHADVITEWERNRKGKRG